jgi:acyl carrier protein
MRRKIVEIVTHSVTALNEMLNVKVPVEMGESANLYGSAGLLDSLSLVNLIVLTEERIEDEFGVGIILASEKAMSQKRSPFATIGSLVDYIEGILSEDKANG